MHSEYRMRVIDEDELGRGDGHFLTLGRTPPPYNPQIYRRFESEATSWMRLILNPFHLFPCKISEPLFRDSI